MKSIACDRCKVIPTVIYRSKKTGAHLCPNCLKSEAVETLNAQRTVIPMVKR